MDLTRNLLLVILFAGACTGKKRTCDSRIEVPAGFCATLFADDVGPVRHLAVSGSGKIYAALWRESQRTGGILVLQDTSGDGVADRREKFGAEGGSGIAIRDSLLFFATWSTVYRYTLNDGAYVPDREPERVGNRDAGNRARSAKHCRRRRRPALSERRSPVECL